MALINVLANNQKDIDWRNISDHYSKLGLTLVEIFPIPKELGFENDHIGICVHRGYSNRKAIIKELESATKFFLSRGFKMLELYNGSEIFLDNAISIFENLLPDS
jgi:hypothetical protein